jgi:hypothetical protein
MEVKERHGAVIRLDLTLLKAMLDFKGAVIHRVYMDDDYLEPRYCNILMEHPDLPVINDGERASVITPIYMRTYGKNCQLVGVDRIEPKKEKVNET